MTTAHQQQQEVPYYISSVNGTFNQSWVNDNSHRNPNDISIISYNVLSQVQLDRHPFVYADVKDDLCKTWAHRKPLLTNQFEEYARKGIDIIALQEVDDDAVFDFYQPLFQRLGYKFIYQRKCVGSFRDPTPPDGLAFAYRQDRLEFMRHEKVRYLQELGDTTEGLKLSYPNIGLIAKFCLKHSPEKRLTCATTHLTFNPHRGEVKLAQLALLLSKLAIIRSSSEGEVPDPVVITGDMNSSGRGDLISKFLAKGYFKYLEKKCSEISGQFAYHSNLKTIPIPPLPQELGIDYRDCTGWTTSKAEEFHKEASESTIADRDDIPLVKHHEIQHGGFVRATSHGFETSVLKDPLDDKLVSPFDAGVVDYIGHKFDLHSPYMDKSMRDVFSTFFEGEKLQVDHIFVSRTLPVNDYLTLPKISSESRPSLLCRDFPSDHYPIGVNVTL